jgi:hypothetical protein
MKSQMLYIVMITKLKLDNCQRCSIACFSEKLNTLSFTNNYLMITVKPYLSRLPCILNISDAHVSLGLIRFLRAFLSPQYLLNDLVFEASC